MQAVVIKHNIFHCIVFIHLLMLLSLLTGDETNKNSSFKQQI